MAEEAPKPDLTDDGKKPWFRVERRGDSEGNFRRDAMFIAAYAAVCALVYITVWYKDLGEYAQGVVTLVLGMFLNELKNMYNFELGTTRSAAKKDEAIADMSKTAVVTANTAQDKQAASDKAVNIALAAPPGTTGADVALAAGTIAPAVTPAPPLADGTIPAAQADQLTKEKP